MTNLNIKRDLNEVHTIRAFAAIAVTCFHLILGNSALFPKEYTFKYFASFGYLGVESFFILSGYIICYSLPTKFSLENFKPFITKRFLRIYPPYLISVLIAIILNFISQRISDTQSSFDIISVIGNITFLTNFGLGSYINVVYWTLGIEVQFYLLIALAFPFIKTKTSLILIIFLTILLSSLPKLHGLDMIFPQMTLFGLGILIFFYKKKKMIDFTLFIILVSLVVIQIFFFIGINELVASLVCLFILLYWKRMNTIIAFFSNISFSLYLLHTTIGGKVINLGLRFSTTIFEKYLLLSASIICSVLFSYLLYKFVEKPAISWSKRITYDQKT